jgi:hypothetical protein
MAAVASGSTDVLADLDLSFGSSGRGRRRTAASSSSSGSVDVGAASSSSAADTSMSAASGAAAGSSGSLSAPVETQKSDPHGPPPLLCIGDDDIFWVAKLHASLMSHGYYPSDDEVSLRV